MIDVKLIQGSDGVFDIPLKNGDLEGVEGLDTALQASTLTDARASESQVPIPEERRGWLGNVVSTVEGRDLGSLMWLTDQSRLNQDTLNQSVDAYRKSLNWFIEDGLARNIEVTGTIVPLSGITLRIDITSVSGEVSTHYVDLWKVTGSAN